MILPPASVRHLRVSTAAPAGAAVRLRRALDAADLEAPGLPPSAILCVRRLVAPPRPQDVNERAWSEGLRVTLGGVARRAARPIVGGHSDEAVWFADMAELLACLAVDASLRRAPWWWEGLPRPLRPTELVSAWGREVEHVPAALVHLEREGLLEVVPGGLGAAEVSALSQALCIRFGLNDLLAALQRPPNPSAPGSEKQAVSSVLHEISEDPPWARWAPGLPTKLSAEAAALLGVALGLARAPSAVRAPAFVREVVRWRATINLPADERGRSAATRPVGQAPATEEEAQNPASAPPGAPLARPQTADGGAPVAPIQPPVSGPQEGEQIALPAPVEGRTEPDVDIEQSARTPSKNGNNTRIISNKINEVQNKCDAALAAAALHAPPPAPGQPPRSRRAAAAPTLVAPAASPLPQLLPLPEPIATGLGGALYLINVALALGLYGDFTEPLKPGVDLSPWDFVALVTDRLWPEAPADDALWGLLARLAGRPLDGSPEAERLPTPPPWLDELMPALEARLARAMPDLPPPRWLAQAGLILLSSARMEVVFSLETHPIQVRIAGLDRDPGWVPAAGLTLCFRYAA